MDLKSRDKAFSTWGEGLPNLPKVFNMLIHARLALESRLYFYIQ